MGSYKSDKLFLTDFCCFVDLFDQFSVPSQEILTSVTFYSFRGAVNENYSAVTSSVYENNAAVNCDVNNATVNCDDDDVTISDWGEII